MSFEVTIGGTTVQNLLGVSYGQKDESEIGTAEITAANTATNRSFSYGQEVIITRNGETDFVGVLEKKPSTGDRNIKVSMTARDKRAAMSYEEVHRPFFDTDSGAAIREAVEKQIEPRPTVDIFLGSTLSDLSSDAPVFEQANIPSQKLYTRGSDLLFCYWRAEASGSFEVTHSNVPVDAAPGKNLLFLQTRFLFNNNGGYFSGELELRDHGGNNYVWDLEIPDGVGFKEHRYKAQEARTQGAELTTDGTLQYRINISGNIPEPRACVIDYALTRPFATSTRDSFPVDAPRETVPNTGRDITRRFDSTILEMVAQLSVEDGTTSFIDVNDDLHYEPSGDETAPVSIDYSSTRVVEANFNRDATDIINKVTVQGDGDLQVSLQSSGSIEFYGVSARERPLVDKSIQSEEALREWGRGFLNENAWSDTAIEFVVADPSFKNVRVGQSIDITWPPEDVDGTFVVSSTSTDSAGRVTISVTGSQAA